MLGIHGQACSLPTVIMIAACHLWTVCRTRCAELGFGPDADPGYRNAGYR